MPDKRLIDANALKAGFDDGDCMKSLAEAIADKRFVKAIMQAPTIDAVPVVRCRECIHRGTYECPTTQEDYYYDDDDGSDYVMRDYTEDDGFCHKGEKMDGGAS